MADDAIQLSLMKILASKHFPLQAPRPKLKLDKLVAALGRLGTQSTQEAAFVELCELKGKGWVNTDPKIILREEFETAQFEVWLTPLGRTELGKKLSG